MEIFHVDSKTDNYLHNIKNQKLMNKSKIKTAEHKKLEKTVQIVGSRLMVEQG